MHSRDRYIVEPLQPFVAVVFCFVVGVVLGGMFSVPLWMSGGALLLLGVCYLLKRWSITIWGASVVVGAVWMGVVGVGRGEMIYERGLMSVRVESPRSAVVEAISLDGGEEWQYLGRRVMVGGEEAVSLWGEEVLLWGEVWRFGDRDYLSLSRSRIEERDRSRSGVARVSDWFDRRVAALSLSERAESVVRAMVLGRREGLSQELLGSYRASGAAHILAVSGLHVGVVALIFMWLLCPLNLLWRGHLWRAVLVVALIWGYALVVGLTPSVVRAAMMFSALQLATLLRRRYSSLAVLASVVLVLTLFDVGVVYDVGFQLSVVAVLAIILWVMPLWRRLSLGWWGEIFILPLAMGIGCSVAMMPLLALTFGYVSPFGVLLNTLLIGTLYVVLFGALIWTFVGFALVAPLFRWLLEVCVWIQMEGVEWASSGWRGAVDVEVGWLSVVLIYVAYGVVTVSLSRKKIWYNVL